MHLEKNGLTANQRETVGHFLDLFADIEAALKTRLKRRANDRTGVGALIDAYEAKNPYWRDAANRLRHLADIRNVLTHQRGTAFGYPVAVTSHSIEALLAIKEHLLRPEPVFRVLPSNSTGGYGQYYGGCLHATGWF